MTMDGAVHQGTESEVSVWHDSVALLIKAVQEEGRPASESSAHRRG